MTWAPGEQLEISPDHSAGPLGLDVTCMSLVNVKFERAVDVSKDILYRASRREQRVPSPIIGVT